MIMANYLQAKRDALVKSNRKFQSSFELHIQPNLNITNHAGPPKIIRYFEMSLQRKTCGYMPVLIPRSENDVPWKYEGVQTSKLSNQNGNCTHFSSALFEEVSYFLRASAARTTDSTLRNTSSSASSKRAMKVWTLFMCSKTSILTLSHHLLCCVTHRRLR